MAEIAMRDDQLTELLAHMKQRLKDLEKSSKREQELEDLIRECKDAENTIDMFRMEFRTLSPDDKKKYRDRLKKHKDDLSGIRNEIDFLKQNKTRDELLGERAILGPGPNTDTEDGLIDHGRNVMNASVDAMKRTVDTVTNTQTLARDVAVRVQQQTDQIERVYNDLYEIDDMLKRSTEIIKRMMRRTLSNKYLWGLILLIIAAIIFVIVWKATGKTSADVNTPTTLPSG